MVNKMKRSIIALFLIIFSLSAAWSQEVITARRRAPSGGAAPTWAFVQDGANFACTANPCPVTFASPITAGSVVVAGLASIGSPSDTITAVSDSGGSTWTLCGGGSGACQVTNT